MGSRKETAMKRNTAWDMHVIILLVLPYFLPGWHQTPLLAEPQATSAFRVHPETTFQTIVGFGAGFDQTSLQNVNALQKPEDRDRAYDLLYGGGGVRLNIVRLTISPNAQPLQPAGSYRNAGSRYDWATDGHTQSTWKAIEPVLKKTKPVIYAVPFTPPVCWKTNGQPGHGGSLKREHYRQYAEYLVGFLEYHHRVLGVEVDVLSLQNEPGVAAPWDSCVWTGEELRDFLKILAPAVRAMGFKTQLMLSEGTAWTGAWEHLLPTLQDPVARGLLDIMASHSYGAADDKARRQFAAASARNGKPVWMSEMSLMFPPAPDDPGMDAAIQVARYMHRDLVEAHVSTWVYCFAIFTSTFRGSMGVLSPADAQGPLHGTLVVPKRFWAMANYSRFVRPGWKLMGIDGVGYANTGFVDPKGTGFVIVALNPSGKPQPTVYEFGQKAIGNIEAFATTAHLDLARIPAPETAPHRFSVTLLPKSVTTFAGTLGE
jgi:glucuronoarabinoxylan endo-1,4-beta-xylanase